METVEISTLTEFIEWSSQFNPEEYMFRGVSKESYEIEASTYQPLRHQGIDEFNELVRVNEELIVVAHVYYTRGFAYRTSRESLLRAVSISIPSKQAIFLLRRRC